MPRGRPSKNSGSNVRGDDSADLLDGFEALDEHLEALDVEMLTGHRPTRCSSRAGGMGFDDTDYS